MFKIAIIDHVGKKAGMDYYSSSLAKGFLEQKCQCTVFSNFIGIEPDQIIYNSYYDSHSNSNGFFKLFKFIAATLQSSYESRRKKANLVIIHLFSANIVTLLLVLIPKCFGLNVAVISHDISSFIGNDNKLIQSWIYNVLSNHIIVHNMFSFQELMRNMKIKNKDKVAIIKHGGYLDHIDVSASKADAKKLLNLEDNYKYILFFGQIKEVKGLDILLHAMAKVPQDVKLIIAGKPWKSDFSLYDDMITRYGLSERVIKMIRFIEDEERELLFNAADVNVLPYRTIYQSGVLLMAMSHGLPVIASDLPANKEVIRDGENGLLFKNEDVGDLSSKINGFIHNNDLQKKIKQCSVETIKHEYSWKKIAGQYLDRV